MWKYARICILYKEKLNILYYKADSSIRLYINSKMRKLSMKKGSEKFTPRRPNKKNDLKEINQAKSRKAIKFISNYRRIHLQLDENEDVNNIWQYIYDLGPRKIKDIYIYKGPKYSTLNLSILLNFLNLPKLERISISGPKIIPIISSTLTRAQQINILVQKLSQNTSLKQFTYFPEKYHTNADLDLHRSILEGFISHPNIRKIEINPDLMELYSRNMLEIAKTAPKYSEVPIYEDWNKTTMLQSFDLVSQNYYVQSIYGELSSEQYIFLLKSIKSESLKRLEITVYDMECREEFLNSLKIFMKNCPNIETLPLPNDDFPLLFSKLKLPRLITLKLDILNIVNTNILKFITKHRNIKTLVVKGSSELLKSFAKIIKEMNNLESLKIEGPVLLASISNYIPIKELEISCIKPQNIIHLTEYLDRCKHLKTLRINKLENIEIKSNSVQLNTAIKENKSLYKVCILDAASNNLSAFGFNTSIQKLQLNYIDSPNIHIYGTWLKLLFFNPYLKKLELRLEFSEYDVNEARKIYFQIINKILLNTERKILVPKIILHLSITEHLYTLGVMDEWESSLDIHKSIVMLKIYLKNVKKSYEFVLDNYTVYKGGKCYQVIFND